MNIPDVKTIEKIINIPFKRWAKRCHEISLAIVHSGLLGHRVRVARGACWGVTSQHSWIVLGWDCYDPEAQVLDPTLWSYSSKIKGLWSGPTGQMPHTPHGSGSIWSYGQPKEPKGKVIKLDKELSKAATAFMKLAAPKGLDLEGWAALAGSPVNGWPSKEIISAMCDHPQLRGMVPIDIVGMLTDRNPRQLYLPLNYEGNSEDFTG